MAKIQDIDIPYLEFAEAAAPGTPAAAISRIYVKADGLFYSKDDAGAETLMSGGSAGNVATDPIWDAAGDLAVGTGANTAGVLGIGATNDILRVAGGTAAWQTAPAFGSASITANTTTTSTSYIDVTGASVTLTTLARRVKITWLGTVNVGTLNDWVDLTLKLDGADVASQGLAEIGPLPAGAENPFCIVYITAALTAGSHTIKGRVRRAAGSGTDGVIANANLPGFLYVEELLF